MRAVVQLSLVCRRCASWGRLMAVAGACAWPYLPLRPPAVPSIPDAAAQDKCLQCDGEGCCCSMDHKSGHCNTACMLVLQAICVPLPPPRTVPPSLCRRRQ